MRLMNFVAVMAILAGTVRGEDVVRAHAPKKTAVETNSAAISAEARAVKNGLKSQVNEYGARLDALEKAADLLWQNVDAKNKRLRQAKLKLCIFKMAHQRGMQCGFPVQVEKRSYSKEQLKEQIRMVMCQERSYELSLADLRSTLDHTETECSSALTLVDRLETQIVCMDALDAIQSVANVSTEGLDSYERYLTKVIEDVAKRDKQNPHTKLQSITKREWPNCEYLISDADVDDFLNGSKP